jgi:sugar phosphate isomerase/epimerase
MNIAGHDIGVCSWSLRANDTGELISMMRQANLSHLQLSIGPLLGMDESARKAQMDQLTDAGITITAGMISFPGEDYSTIARIRQTGGFLPNELWNERREMAAMAGRICKAFDIKSLSTHIGFVPISSGEQYKTMIDRVSEIAGLLEQEGVSLLMETGQEHAPELLQFINDIRHNVFVNFDPANMLLYGAGDPIDAVATLGRHIGHVHVKDAKESDQPGITWGTEVPFGTGDVPVNDFVNELHRVGYRGPLVIERESGTARLKDVQFAVESLRKALITEEPQPVTEK